jgi:hypothetical protein
MWPGQLKVLVNDPDRDGGFAHRGSESFRRAKPDVAWSERRACWSSRATKVHARARDAVGRAGYDEPNAIAIDNAMQPIRVRHRADHHEQGRRGGPIDRTVR